MVNTDGQIVADGVALYQEAKRLGFAQEGTRADDEIVRTCGRYRVRAERRFIHGEGRLVLRYRPIGVRVDGDGGWAQIDIVLNGTNLADSVLQLRATVEALEGEREYPADGGEAG